MWAISGWVVDFIVSVPDELAKLQIICITFVDVSRDWKWLCLRKRFKHVKLKDVTMYCIIIEQINKSI